MLSYPYEVDYADDVTVEVWFPDFPWIAAFGPNLKRVLPQLERRLASMIEALIGAGLAVPAPSDGRTKSALPPELALKVRTYWNLEAAGTPRAVLAGALGEGLPALRALRDSRPGDLADPERRRAAALALAIRDAAEEEGFQPLREEARGRAGFAAAFGVSAGSRFSPS